MDSSAIISVAILIFCILLVVGFLYGPVGMNKKAEKTDEEELAQIERRISSRDEEENHSEEDEEEEGDDDDEEEEEESERCSRNASSRPLDDDRDGVDWLGVLDRLVRGADEEDDDLGEFDDEDASDWELSGDSLSRGDSDDPRDSLAPSVLPQRSNHSLYSDEDDASLPYLDEYLIGSPSFPSPFPATVPPPSFPRPSLFIPFPAIDEEQHDDRSVLSWQRDSPEGKV
jgi:hypothetical protein